MTANAKSTKKLTDWMWWKHLPHQEILEDMIAFRERNNRWPEVTEFKGLRHMTSEMSWNFYFIGYRDAIMQANELWVERHPRRRSARVGYKHAMVEASPWQAAVMTDGVLSKFTSDPSGSMA